MLPVQPYLLQKKRATYDYFPSIKYPERTEYLRGYRSYSAHRERDHRIQKRSHDIPEPWIQKYDQKMVQHTPMSRDQSLEHLEDLVTMMSPPEPREFRRGGMRVLQEYSIIIQYRVRVIEQIFQYLEPIGFLQGEKSVQMNLRGFVPYFRISGRVQNSIL